MTDGRRCERKVVRRLHASFSGSPWVGNGLDGELLDLHHRSGRTLPTVVRLISCDSSLSKIHFITTVLTYYYRWLNLDAGWFIMSKRSFSCQYYITGG
jgi:hypothetical protein